MFAVTQRLLLRPGWIEDAPELTAAIAHQSVVRNLARAPWPYALGDAEGFLSSERDPLLPSFQIIDRTQDPVRLIGGIGIQRDEDGDIEFGYWLTPSHWGRGFATEAGHAALAAIRSSLGYRRIVAGHFVDNPASGRVLEKLGFRPTGRIEPRFSTGRGCDADCVLFELDEETEKASDMPALAA